MPASEPQIQTLEFDTAKEKNMEVILAAKTRSPRSAIMGEASVRDGFAAIFAQARQRLRATAEPIEPTSKA